jgi:hypothetical protein
VIPWVRVGSGFYSLFLHCLRAEVPFRCKQAFPREEKCLLDHLSPFGISRSPQSVLQSFTSYLGGYLDWDQEK